MLGLPQGGIEDGPEVDDPPQENEPEDAGQDELDDRHEEAPLKQLPQAGNEEATERSYDVACRSLPCHAAPTCCPHNTLLRFANHTPYPLPFQLVAALAPCIIGSAMTADVFRNAAG